MPVRLTPDGVVVPEVEILEGVIQEITRDRSSLVVATRERWIDIGSIELLCGAVVAIGTGDRDWAPAELPFRVVPTLGGGWEIGVSIPLGSG